MKRENLYAEYFFKIKYSIIPYGWFCIIEYDIAISLSTKINLLDTVVTEVYSKFKI